LGENSFLPPLNHHQKGIGNLKLVLHNGYKIHNSKANIILAICVQLIK